MIDMYNKVVTVGCLYIQIERDIYKKRFIGFLMRTIVD